MGIVRNLAFMEHVQLIVFSTTSFWDITALLVQVMTTNVGGCSLR